MIRLFLGLVRRGLEELRAQIVEGLRTAKFDVANMEIFGARPELPLESCLAEIRKCDALILIVGPRYGALTDAGDVSFTREGFREACRRGIPVLAFILPPAADAPDEEQQRLREVTAEVGQVIPAVSDWGMIVLDLLVLAAGAPVLRRGTHASI